MTRFTLAHFIALGGGIPVGICANDISGNAQIANIAQMQLLDDPLTPDEGWWGGWMRMQFAVTSQNMAAYIVTPVNVARVIQLSICQRPIRIRNSFYENMEFSIGPQPRICQPQKCGPDSMEAFERDTVVTALPFPGTPQNLRVYLSDPADLGKRIVLQGPDQNGTTIFGTDIQTQAAILGETIYMALPFSDALNTYSGLTGIQKDPTLGIVQIFTVDPATGDQTLLTTMDPGETTAQYRRYLLNGLPCGCCTTPGGTVQVIAECRLDFMPVRSPSDYLTIQSLTALMEEVQSIRYSTMDSQAAPQFDDAHHKKALALLNGQLDKYLGKVQTAVRVPIFGSDRLRAQPV